MNAEDARPAPTPAPVAVPEGVSTDRFVIGQFLAWLNGTHEGPVHRGTANLIDAMKDNGWSRPEPVVAPLPSEVITNEAVEAAARALYVEEQNESMGFDQWPDYDHPDNAGKPIYEHHARAALTAALPHLGLAPEDDEDTVRVPREAVEEARTTLRSRGWTLPPAAVSAALAAALPHRHLVVSKEALDAAVEVMADAVYAKTGRPADLSELEADLRRALTAALPLLGPAFKDGDR